MSIKAVEALPLELQRNYTLIRQLDINAEDIMTQVATEAKDLSSVATMAELSIEERRAKLEHIGQLLNEVLKKGEEKFALAKSTYDTVKCISCNSSRYLFILNAMFRSIVTVLDWITIYKRLRMNN